MSCVCRHGLEVCDPVLCCGACCSAVRADVQPLHRAGAGCTAAGQRVGWLQLPRHHLHVHQPLRHSAGQLHPAAGASGLLALLCGATSGGKSSVARPCHHRLWCLQVPAGLHAALALAAIGQPLTVVLNPELAFGDAGLPGSVPPACQVVVNVTVFGVSGKSGSGALAVGVGWTCVPETTRVLSFAEDASNLPSLARKFVAATFSKTDTTIHIDAAGAQEAELIHDAVRKSSTHPCRAAAAAAAAAAAVDFVAVCGLVFLPVCAVSFSLPVCLSMHLSVCFCDGRGNGAHCVSLCLC